MKTEPDVIFNPLMFKRIVVWSTALGFATALGSMAAVQHSPGRGFEFGWNWSIPIWMCVGALISWKFWNAALEFGDRVTPGNKRNFAIYCALFVALGIGEVLYPIRFVDRAVWMELAKGLLTAACFLSTGAFIIFKIGRAFGQMDATELKRIETEADKKD